MIGEVLADEGVVESKPVREDDRLAVSCSVCAGSRYGGCSGIVK